MRKFLPYFLVFILGFVFCAWVLRVFWGAPGGDGPITASVKPRGGIGVANTGKNPVRQAAEVVSDYVVNIDTVGRPVIQSSGSPFDFLFGQPQEVVPKGQGSGVVFTRNGYIVTNNHVVAGAAKLTVTLRDGKRYEAKLIGRDPKTDIAVIKIPVNNLHFAEFADSNTLQVGDWVIAVGSPLGLESTVTAGVVSATRRGPLNLGNEVLADVIQTDAAINPGNSGGALADLNGDLVGINTAIASTSGGSIGIGFAIPSNTAKRVAEELIKHGKVRHPYIGIKYGLYNDEMRDFLKRRGVENYPKEDGVIIAEVYQNSPAADAGLQPQDVILKINGKPISGSERAQKGTVSFTDVISKSKIGERVLLEVWHASNNQRGTVGVRIGEMPEGYGEQQPGSGGAQP